LGSQSAAFSRTIFALWEKDKKGAEDEAAREKRFLVLHRLYDAGAAENPASCQQ
jgi:hypothetical protein